uniref:Uncharacterized protein n=1 Tax=Anopheles farauti TaxID=69004 RepID=A0A182Q6I9_9DIPT
MYIVERYRALVKYYLERRTCDTRVQLKLLMQYNNDFAGLIGLNAFSPNYSPANPRFRLLMLDFILFCAINLHNLNASYGDLVNFMYCLVSILYVGIAIVKMNVFIRHNRLIAKLLRFSNEFYERFNGDAEQNRLLGAFTLDTYLLALLFAFCSMSAAALIFVYSLVWSLTVEYALPFGFFIPRLEIEQLKGFLINFAYQLLQCFLLVTGLVPSEIAFFIFVLQACLQVDMLQLELERLGKLSAANRDGQHNVEIRKRIQTIIQHHIDHVDFVKSLCNLFELHYFVVFGCIFGQLVCIVVVVVTTNRTAYQLTVGSSPILSLAHTTDNTLVTQEKEGTVKLWSLSNAEYVRQHEISTEHVGFCRVVLDPLTNTVIIPRTGAAISVLCGKTMNEMMSFTPTAEHEKRLSFGTVMCVQPIEICGQWYLLAGYESGSIAMWDYRTGQLIDAASLFTTDGADCLQTLDYDPITNRGVGGGSADKLAIFSIDFKTQKIVAKGEIAIKNAGVHRVRIRKDLKVFVSAGWDGRLRIFSWKSLRPLAVLTEHKGEVLDVAYSDGKVTMWNAPVMAAAGSDGQISLWDLYK